MPQGGASRRGRKQPFTEIAALVAASLLLLLLLYLAGQLHVGDDLQLPQQQQHLKTRIIFSLLSLELKRARARE